MFAGARCRRCRSSLLFVGLVVSSAIVYAVLNVLTRTTAGGSTSRHQQQQQHGEVSQDDRMTRDVKRDALLRFYVTSYTVVKVDRRIRWHYTTTVLRLRIGARLTFTPGFIRF